MGKEKVKSKRSGFKTQHPRESFALQSMSVEWCRQGVRGANPEGFLPGSLAKTARVRFNEKEQIRSE